MAKKSDSAMLDEALAQQKAGTYTDPVEEAKAFLAQKGFPASDAEMSAWAQSQVGQRKAEQRLSPTGRLEAYGAPAMNAGRMAAIPASFLGGPLGMMAGGVLAAEGVNDAVEHPSLESAAFAALGALPFVKPLRGMAAAGREAKWAKEAEGAGDLGATFSHETPGSSYPPGGKDDVLSGSGYTHGQDSQLRSIIDRLRAKFGLGGEEAATAAPRTGNVPPPGPVGAATGPGAVAEGGSEAEAVVKGIDEAMARQAPGGTLERPGRDVVRSVQGEVMPPRQVTSGAGVEPRGQGGALTPPERGLVKSVAGEVVEPTQLGAGPRGLAARPELPESMQGLLGGQAEGGMRQLPEGQRMLPAGGTTRPSPDFMHEADTSGSAFGFDELPPLSEGELLRLQELFKTAGNAPKGRLDTRVAKRYPLKK